MAKENKTAPMQEAFGEVLDLLRDVDPAKPEGVASVDIDKVVEQLEVALEGLNTQMEQVCKDTGMSKEELEKYASNPENFSKEEWKLLEEFRTELGKFQQEAEKALAESGLEGTQEEPKKRKRRRKHKQWLQG